MEHVSEKATEQLHAKIPSETNKPHAQDLKSIQAKHVAYYEKRIFTHPNANNKQELAVLGENLCIP